ncbi:hypothetical protein BDZ89DRAFT_1216060 [Hymenopellis radicata]|nr:hypothetical protein BDZ89DRAFT_1216060 [Hymenopellis radicata]
MWEELFGTEAGTDDDDEPTFIANGSDDLHANKENILAASPPRISLSAESTTQCSPPTDHHPAVVTEKIPSLHSAQRSKAHSTPQPPAITALQPKPLSCNLKNTASGIPRSHHRPCVQNKRNHVLPPTVVQEPPPPSAGTQAAGSEVALQEPTPRTKASKRKAAGDDTMRRVKDKKKAEKAQLERLPSLLQAFRPHKHWQRPPPMPVDNDCMTLYQPPIPHLRSQQLAPNEALYASELPVRHVLQLVFAQWHNTERESVFPEELDLGSEASNPPDDGVNTATNKAWRAGDTENHVGHIER